VPSAQDLAAFGQGGTTGPLTRSSAEPLGNEKAARGRTRDRRFEPDGPFGHNRTFGQCRVPKAYRQVDERWLISEAISALALSPSRVRNLARRKARAAWRPE